MKDNKVKKIVIISSFVIVILVLVWFLIIYPLIDFSGKEDKLLNAAKAYYEKNAEALPNEGTTTRVSMDKLVNQKYLEPLTTTYGSKRCNEENSWVRVKKANGEYEYSVYLECGNMKSSGDHEGPTIKLNGSEEETIEKYSTYTDPGVKSVYDDTDGKMDIKKVKVEGKVNTNKIGTYVIKYTATDSLNNKNIVKRTVTVEQTLDKLVKKDTGKSLIYNDTNPNNYIKFSNMMFRIVGLNSDGTVRIVSEESAGAVNYDDLEDWLNDYYYDHIDEDFKDYMVRGKFCSSKIAKDKFSTTKDKCDDTNKNYVGVLSVSEYNKLGFMNPGNITWTSDYTNDKEAITVSNDFIGQVENYMSFNKKYNFSVKPAINLKEGIKIKKGSGTPEEPYEFLIKKKGRTGEKVNTRTTGEYVKYAGITYRIINVESDGTTKVISNDTIGEDIGYEDSDKVKKYNPNKKGNIGYIINNTASKYIKSDIFVNKKISVSIYDKAPTYSGKKTEKEYTVKFSAPDMYEIYSGVYENSGNSYWLRTSSNTEGNIYVVSPINVIYYDEMDNYMQAGMRVVGYLNKNTSILSGNGTLNNPYILTK